MNVSLWNDALAETAWRCCALYSIYDDEDVMLQHFLLFVALLNISLSAPVGITSIWSQNTNPTGTNKHSHDLLLVCRVFNNQGLNSTLPPVHPKEFFLCCITVSLLFFVCACVCICVCPSRCYGGEERHTARHESVELKWPGGADWNSGTHGGPGTWYKHKDTQPHICNHSQTLRSTMRCEFILHRRNGSLNCLE